MDVLKKYGWILVIPILALLAALLAIRIVNSIDWQNNDFFTFWLAGHLILQGGNPYDPTQWLAGHHQFGVTWIPNQAYVYPLPLSLVYAPLGALALKMAYIVWVAVSQLMMLGALILLLSSGPGKRLGKFFLPILVGLIFFRPTTLTLVNGQMSALLLLLLALTVYFWEKGQWEWGSLPLPFLMLKPNLGAPILVLLGLWLLVRRRFRPLLVISAGLLALLVIGLIQNPHWVSDYWSIGNLKVSQNLWGVPTLWGLGFMVCRHNAGCTLAFGGITSALLGLAFVWWAALRWKDITPFSLVALVVTVTLLVTPYIWTYDQLLLLVPVVDLIRLMDRKGVRFILSSLFFIGLDAIIVILLIFDTQLDVEIFNALIPLLLLVLYPLMRMPSTRRRTAFIIEP